jgi:hypothetical protein
VSRKRLSTRPMRGGGEHPAQPRADLGDLRGAHGVRHGVLVPLDLIAQGLERVARSPSPRERNQRVLGAVRHEDRHVAIGGVGLGGEGVGQGQVGRQREDAREALGIAQPGVERDGSALGETGQDDSMARDAPRLLPLDERLDLLLGGADAGGVLAAIVGDVVPGPHGEAAVDGDGLHRGVREHEAHAPRRGQAELRHDGLEVVAVGAETVQPDHRRLGGAGAAPRHELDRVRQRSHD